jgi:CRISPR-associated protein Cas1
MNVLEISKNNIHLSKQRGFILLKEKDKSEQKLALDNIEAIIVSGFGISYSHNLLQECCTRNIPLILCGKNFMPCGCFHAYSGYFKQNQRIIDQINASKPFYKKTWQKIISYKIKNQAAVLTYYDKNDQYLTNLSGKVKSGDPDNLEAQAARIYWQKLFGKKFKRDFEAPGINAFLNFGYAVLRSCLVKQIIAKGLLPSWGIHHKNKTNPYCLADDLIEPFRPFIDLAVVNLAEEEDLNTECKRKLVEVLVSQVKFQNKYCTLENVIKLSVESFINSLQSGKVVNEYAEIRNIKWTSTHVDDCNV